jgi:LysM repeat protein
MRNLTKIVSICLVFSILLGGALLPALAEASIFSSLFGDQAYADVYSLDGIDSTKNSQTLELLQANVSSASVVQDQITKTDKSKDTKKDPKDLPNKIDQNANVNIVSDNAIAPATGPMGVSDGKDIGGISPDEVSVYVVRKGDSIGAIADMFGVSINTILSVNDIKKGDKLKEGDVLLILPISGVKHLVKKGETLQSIAKSYRASVDDIVFYNDIEANTKLSIGDELMIPGGEISDDTTSSSKPTSKNSPVVSSSLKIIAGYFINPVPEYKRKSQGLHGPGNRGIDLAAPIGTRIVASASGRVSLARNGYNGGYGNMVIIEHPNGTRTLYAHMSKLGTQTGAQVSQGEVIGYVGSTGRSTGPHLHFEVFNARNPGADWSWAK